MELVLNYQFINYYLLISIYFNKVDPGGEDGGVYISLIAVTGFVQYHVTTRIE